MPRRGDHAGGAIMNALKQSNERLQAGRCGATKPANRPGSSAKQYRSEVEDLVAELEGLASSSGFGDDKEFTDMCQGLRHLDKMSKLTPMHIMSFHTMVREASQAQSLGDRVRGIQKTHGWFTEVRAHIKRKERAELKAARAAKKESLKRRALVKEGLRQRQEKAEMEAAAAKKIEDDKLKKAKRRQAEQVVRREQVQQWTTAKKKKQVEDEQAAVKVQEELKKQRTVQRKLVIERQRMQQYAETQRREAEAQAARTNEMLLQAEKREARIEEQVARRVKAEVQRQLKQAVREHMKEHMEQLEAEMFDASFKAKSYQKQCAIQDSTDEIVVEEAVDEVEEDNKWEGYQPDWGATGGDWGDSDDDGLLDGEVPPEVQERLCIANESDEEDSTALEKAGGWEAIEDHVMDGDDTDFADIDEEKARLLGIPIQPLALRTTDLNKNNEDPRAASKRVDSPMTSRFWDQPSFNSETQVGDRVKAAVDRARRMAELAHERRTARATEDKGQMVGCGGQSKENSPQHM